MSKEQEYHPLMGSDPSDELEDSPPQVKAMRESKLSRTAVVAIILLVAETVALVLTLLALVLRSPQTSCTVSFDSQRVLYSPALAAIEHEVKVYTIGFSSDFSPYQIPSSPELDELWSKLYNFGISRISKEEAARLPNKTHAIPGDEGYYIAELDVFHNLHCLNKIRMALDPDYYPEWRISTTNNRIPSQTNVTRHVSHCVDWIRQAIQCSSDTSVIVWQWDDTVKRNTFRGDVAHTCRSFEKIQEWAKSRALPTVYDPTVLIEDDIIVPIFHNEIP
ncbi:hypothetical protein C8R43DRAFT_1176994 [Mycena crocata]|nr:hypothetical protein C8R43DRAFT_1176994 [Mycena crocata]